MSLDPRSVLKAFVREDRGSVIVEAVIILPILIWAYVAMFVYWDAYRYQNTASKASYTVADMVTREVKDIDDAYIDGLKIVFDYQLDADLATSMTVSSVTWVQARNRYEVLWSEGRGPKSYPLNTAKVQDVKTKLPVMADGDSVILVQTMVDYVPLFEVGVPSFTHEEFIVTRPRRAPKINCPTCGIGV